MTDKTELEVTQWRKIALAAGKHGIRYRTNSALLQFFADIGLATRTPDPTPVAWMPIESAPKGATPQNPCNELWLLGVDAHGEQRVMRWCLEYPETSGCWMFAYEPSDYITGIQSFNPTHWMPLPPAPKRTEDTRDITPPAVPADELVEALEAIIDRAPERDRKWFGMTAKDIATQALAAYRGEA